MVDGHGIPPGARHGGGGWPAGWHVRVVDEVPSTNTALMADALAGAADRTVLAAGHQTAGRGRLNRAWEAPPGSNLLASILFREVPPVPVELTHRVGLAACLVARDILGDAVMLKWPNDVLVGRAKLAGILAELGPGHSFVVVGLGLNVGWHPVGGARLGGQYDPAAILAMVLERFDRLPADVGDLYRDHLGTLGTHVRVTTATGTVEGTAVDVDPTGRLIVRVIGGLERAIDTGDVVHVR